MKNLILKSILGFLFLVLILALALFLSAGSLGFWQAWVYLAVFSVCVILITAYLAKYDQRLLASRARSPKLKKASRSFKALPVCSSLVYLLFPGWTFVSAGRMCRRS